MPDTIVGFTSGRNKVSLVVRGKQGPDHHPDKLDQHADCILQIGAPMGFFGEGNDGSLNGIGLGMNGVVYDYALFQRHRPQYVDLNMAVSRRVVSTVLMIEVDRTTANKFDEAWWRMRTNPGSFDIVGNNCATHASAAFIYAGLVTSGIPWMDTPDNLYGQLVDRIPAGSAVHIRVPGADVPEASQGDLVALGIAEGSICICVRKPPADLDSARTHAWLASQTCLP
jgi:hypothetical protein